MKKLFLSTALVSLVTGLQAEEQLYTEAKRGLSRPANATILSARDFGSSVNATKELSTAGTYILTQDVGFKSETNPDIAIEITGDNITLDLGGHTLYYDTDAITAVDNVQGVKVNAKKNVVIKNGTLAKFTGEAILVAENSRGITIENVTIMGGSGESSGGIHLKGTAAGASTAVLDSTIRNCTVEKINGTGADDAFACKIAFSENILVEDCNFLRSEGYATSSFNGYGLWINACTNVQVKNCYSAGHTGATVYCFSTTGTSRSCIFENCIASGAFGSSSAAYGFYISDSQGNIFNNCQSIGHEGAYSSYGVYLYTSSHNRFENCYAANNHSIETNGTAVGFHSNSGWNNMFINCESAGNNGGFGKDSSLLAGFEFGYNEKQSSWISCVARGNGNLSAGGTPVYGFFISDTTTVDYCEIRNCQAIANCSSSTGGTAIGFKDNSSASTNLFIDNFAFGNTTGSAVDNYSVNVAVGSFAELSADVGSLLDLANKPLYYNVGVSS